MLLAVTARADLYSVRTSRAGVAREGHGQIGAKESEARCSRFRAAKPIQSLSPTVLQSNSLAATGNVRRQTGRHRLLAHLRLALHDSEHGHQQQQPALSEAGTVAAGVWRRRVRAWATDVNWEMHA